MVPNHKTDKWTRIAVALVLLFSGFMPFFNGGNAAAYQLMQNRYIQLSSSADGSLADGQDVTYKVGFTVADDSQDIGGIVVEFCANSPILGDACTAPSGFSTNAATLAFTDQSGTAILATAGFTIDVANSTANKIVLNQGASAANPGVGEVIEFDFGTAAAGDGIDNPENTNTTFYGRIITFTTATGADQYASQNIDNSGANIAVDAGGTAMSTANQITITAKVPERLTFCVFTVDDTGSPNTCGQGAGNNGDLGGNSITLGDNNGVLSDLEEFINKEARYTVSTNALYGVAIRMKGTTLKTTPTCADTPGEACSIDAAGNVAVASSSGVEQFGVCTYESTATTQITPAAPYDDATCSATTHNSNVVGNDTPGDAANGASFGFDTDAGLGTNSTYGDVIANKQAGTYSTGVLAFIGNIAVTTEPGIYTTTLTFIATGTY